MLVFTFLTLAGSIAAFSYIPKGLFPMEDTGFVFASTEAAQDISYEAMVQKQARAADIIRAEPSVKNVLYAVGGFGGSYNTGRIFITLKPRNQRPPVGAVIGKMKKDLAQVEGLNVFLLPMQNIQIGGRLSKSLYQYTLTGSDLQQLYEGAVRLEQELRRTRGFADVTTDLQLESLQAYITPDRDRAASFGLTNDTIRKGLYSAYGDLQIGSLYTSTNDYQVIMGVTDEAKKSPEDIGRLYLHGGGEKLVPLSAVAEIRRAVGPLSINHQGQMPAVTVSFNLAEGMALGTAVDQIEKIQKKINMSSAVSGSFQGNAQVFQKSAAGQGALIGITIVIIYIILGMLYESFLHPVTILSGLPAAGIGAVISLLLMGMDLSIIAIVGVILLIGIVKKNAIMMVDFAVSRRAEGKSAEESIYQACLLRFRPIMMTTFSTIFGALPIAFAFGAGSELRQPLGVAVVGGLLVSQLLTLYITPVVYLYLEGWRSKGR